jgi:hypothetical protein
MSDFDNVTPEAITGTPRAEAIAKIKDMAREQGLGGQFKVKYKGVEVSSPNDLPETVEMSQVSVIASLDQASAWL